MNVIELEILLRLFVSPTKYYSAESDEKCRAVDHLIEKGLLDYIPMTGKNVAITEKGIAHIEGILQAPLPEQIWVSPINKVS